MWSPKPGVSMTVSFIRTPFSSMSAQITAPAALGEAQDPDTRSAPGPAGYQECSCCLASPAPAGPLEAAQGDQQREF